MTINQIYGGVILNGDTGCFERIDLNLESGVIKEMGLLSVKSSAFDATGLYVIPGFIDTHIHGSMGSEFASESESFDEEMCIRDRLSPTTGKEHTIKTSQADTEVQAICAEAAVGLDFAAAQAA